VNRIAATIQKIDTAGAISLVTLSAHGYEFCCVLIETPETVPYLQLGHRVWMIFKETELSVAVNWQGEISLRNRFPGTVCHLEFGQILTNVGIDFFGTHLTAIITTQSARRMGLVIGAEVVGMVKTTELAIMAEPQDF
jgi:molybdate transport system regulatory protein